jgi:hypothetical protein
MAAGPPREAELYRRTSGPATPRSARATPVQTPVQRPPSAPLLRSPRRMKRGAIRLVLALALPGCGGQTGVSPHAAPGALLPAASARGAKDAEPEPAMPARVFPPSDRSDVTAESKDSDGGRRFIAQGLRLIESPSGALEAANEFLPGTRIAASGALPGRLSGGHLFVLNSSGSALLWKATSWTGKLVPLARIDGEVERVVAGFDRLYVLRSRGAPWIALDAESGQALDLGSLPPSPGYGSMAFADEWLGAVELPLRGVLATFDAGGAWHSLGIARAELSVDEGGIVVSAPNGRFLLGPGGTQTPLADPKQELARKVGPAKPDARRLPAPLPLGPRPLETAVLHGYREAEGTALVAAWGKLARVRLRDGAVLAEQADAYPGRAPCNAVTYGAGPAFVCGEPHGATTLYSLGAGLTLRRVLGFAEPRRIAQNGQGALLVRGSCAERGALEPVRCVLPPSGAPFETPVRNPDERAVALGDGGVALLAPAPRATPKQSREASPKPPAPNEAVGTLVLVRPGEPDRTLALRLSHVEDRAAAALVRDGFWLDAFEQAKNGELRGWVAGGDSFVGVRVKLDGQVLVGTPEQHLDRALLSGRFGLIVGRSGGLRETIDGGFDWTDGELPAEPDLRQERTFGSESGCSILGCAVSGWLRVGWKMGERDKLATARAPEPTRLLGAGGNRWSLDCRATGEQSRPALRNNPQPEDRALSPWNPLGEVAPPPKGRADLALETSSEAELRLFHAYAYGPPGDGWARDARWLVRVRDPFRVGDGVWSTAPTPSAWSSAVLASDAFGRSPSGPPSNWRLVADPVKHTALLIVSIRGALELFLLEEGRTVSRVKTQGTLGVVSSVALSGGRFYVGATGESRALRLYRIERGELELIGEFPDVSARADAPVLAPATQGEGIGVWLHDADYYLFPFEPETRRFDAPIVARASDLATMPPPCSTGEDGYVVGDALALEPNVDLGPDPAATGNGIEVRLIVSPRGACVDGLSAPLGSRSEGRERLGRALTNERRPAIRGVRTPSSEPRGDTPLGGVSARDAGPGAPLILAAPDGSRRAFRCVD